MRCAGGNLRNGSNAGSSYLNLRNRLGNARWNYAAGDYKNMDIAPHFAPEKGVGGNASGADAQNYSLRPSIESERRT